MIQQFSQYSSNDWKEGSNLLDGPSAERLMKAISAGSGAGQGAQGYRGLVREDLESTLFTTTYTEDQFFRTLWWRLKKKPVTAKAIMHEFATLTSHGM